MRTKKEVKNQKGITLIALVITIVLNAGRVDCVKKLRDEKTKNIVKGKIKR